MANTEEIKDINKVVEDYYKVKSNIHYDRPPIKVLSNNELEFSFDVSVYGNGKRMVKVIPVSTLILFIKDLIAVTPILEFEKMELNYKYLNI